MSVANCARRDHPREYGENMNLEKAFIWGLGSSPRIRGESAEESETDDSDRDHPREYGENIRVSHQLGAQNGSSPRIRGECRVALPISVSPWIIPANTGRMANPSMGWGGITDHPREYGENMSGLLKARGYRGSSPRIRGECAGAPVETQLDGIIPANTGRINTAWGRLQNEPDHPREYGENMLLRKKPLARLGSSPRIRGEFVEDPDFFE